MTENKTKMNELISMPNLPAPVITNGLKSMGGNMQEGIRNIAREAFAKGLKAGRDSGYAQGLRNGQSQGMKKGIGVGVMGIASIELLIVASVAAYKKWNKRKPEPQDLVVNSESHTTETVEFCEANKVEEQTESQNTVENSEDVIVIEA